MERRQKSFPTDARRQADRPAMRNVQIQCRLGGKLGCEDGIRRGQALSGIKDSAMIVEWR